MVYRGRVENGAIRLEEAPALPEGAEVEVRVLAEEALAEDERKRCGWLPFVLKQLAAISVLPDGWDANGAARPDARLVNAARGLIGRLAQIAGLSQPHVNPTRAGGVQFEWESGDRYFELEIVDERTAEYLYSDDAAPVEKTGSVSQQGSLDDVIDHIRNVAESAAAASCQ